MRFIIARRATSAATAQGRQSDSHQLQGVQLELEQPIVISAILEITGKKCLGHILLSGILAPPGGGRKPALTNARFSGSDAAWLCVRPPVCTCHTLFHTALNTPRLPRPVREVSQE